jgi:hypothetical protein
VAAPTVPTSAQGSSAGTTSSTITLPTTQADDILIWVWVNGGATATPTFTTGTYNGGAFTSIDAGTWTTGAGGVRWSRCTGNHSGQTLIASGTTNSAATKVAVVRGCLTSATPVDTNVSGASNNPATNTLAAFNTTVGETLVCLTVAVDDNQAITSPLKNAVAMNATTIGDSSGGTDSAAYFASLDQTATGTTGSFAFTVAAGTSEGKRVSAFALKPQPAPQTINAGVASEADSATASTVIQPQLKLGGVASEADSGPAATMLQPQVPVAGGIASESDTALAATVSQPQPPVAGGVASEADSAPGGTAQQGFQPSHIAGLEVWLDASAIGGADGDPVTTWANPGSANDATGASGQTLQTNEINGLPVVRFDGTDDVMSVSNVLNNDATRTVFAVVSLGAGNASNDAVISWGANSGFDVSAVNSIRWRTDESSVVVPVGNPGTGVPCLIAIRLNSTSSADHYFGLGSAANFNPNDAYQSGTAAFALASRTAAGSTFGAVDIGEVLVYDSALSDTDLEDVREYLYQKWLAEPQVVNAGVASESDTAPAATKIQPQAPVSGGVASEADSAPAATKIQPQAPVAGGVASEADSALAATKIQPQAPVSGGVASESDTALAATKIQPQAPVSGGVASEADSAPTATVNQSGEPTVVSGGVASEADSAPAAARVLGAAAASEADAAVAATKIQPQAPVAGGVASESDTAPAATVDQAEGDQTINAGIALEADAAIAALVVGGAEPPDTSPTLGGYFDETATGGFVVQRNRSGVLTATIRGGVVQQGPRGGEHDETATGGSHDETPTGGLVH